MVKRIVLALLVLGGVAAVMNKALAPRPPKGTDVTTAKVEREDLTRRISAAGKLRSANTVKLSPSVSGNLIERPVRIGDKVRRGQVLLRIDPSRYQAQVKSAKAAFEAAQAEIAVQKVGLARAHAERERIAGLVAKGLASPAELQQLESQAEAEAARLGGLERRAQQAQGQLDEAEDFLKKTVLLSPIDGEVIDTPHDIGERIRGSDLSDDPVLYLATLSQMEVKAEVGEHEVVALHLGDEAEVELDAFENRTFKGHLVEIGQYAIVRNEGTEAETTTYPVKVALDERPEGSLPGMSALVRISSATHLKALVLPLQAITLRPKTALAKVAGKPEGAVDIQPAGGGKKKVSANEAQKVVFVLKDGKVAMRPVTTGLSSETQVELLEGVAEGEVVVSGPYRTLAKELKDGDAVVAPEPSAVDGGSAP